VRSGPPPENERISSASQISPSLCAANQGRIALLRHHGKLKRLIKPTLGFQWVKTAYATIKGFADV
jgi:transposase-like protein